MQRRRSSTPRQERRTVVNRPSPRTRLLPVRLSTKRIPPRVPVEFIEDYWYNLRLYTGRAYTSPDNRILHFARGTGYWRREDSEHPDYQQYIDELVEQEIHAEEEEARQRLEAPEAQELYEQAEAEEATAYPPTLTVTNYVRHSST